MIVNPAYAFYAKKEPLPDFNLWAGGVVNVPYTVNNARWNQGSNTFLIYSGGYIDFTVNAKGYSKFLLQIAAGNMYGGDVNISFYNSGGDLISTISKNITQYNETYTLDIPNNARIANAKIRIQNTSSGISYTMYGATLQE